MGGQLDFKGLITGEHISFHWNESTLSGQLASHLGKFIVMSHNKNWPKESCFWIGNLKLPPSGSSHINHPNFVEKFRLVMVRSHPSTWISASSDITPTTQSRPETGQRLPLQPGRVPTANRGGGVIRGQFLSVTWNQRPLLGGSSHDLYSSWPTAVVSKSSRVSIVINGLSAPSLTTVGNRPSRGRKVVYVWQSLGFVFWGP